MQVLYQLSYGPMWIEGLAGSGVPSWLVSRAVSMQKAYTAAGPHPCTG